MKTTPDVMRIRMLEPGYILVFAVRTDGSWYLAHPEPTDSLSLSADSLSTVSLWQPRPRFGRPPGPLIPRPSDAICDNAAGSPADGFCDAALAQATKASSGFTALEPVVEGYIVVQLSQAADLRAMFRATAKTPRGLGVPLRYPRPNYDMATMLMDHGVTADDANGMGMTTLHILIGLGTIGAASWLLDRGADMNLRDHEFDSTALAWAARFGREDMVKLLRSRGAQSSLPDDEPWTTPAAWARRRGHSEILKLL